MENNKSKQQAEETQTAKAVDRREFFRSKAPVAALGALAGLVSSACQVAETQNAQGQAKGQGTIGQTGTEGGMHGVYPGQTPQTARMSQGKKLRDLLARKGVVLAVPGVPDAIGATKMEAAGVETAFIGTGLLFRRLGAVPDTGLVTATESLWIAKFLAESVYFPLILDGDTGHGGPPAVKRFVKECIRIGLAGIRIDDQEIEAKRSTGSGGIVVVSREHAVERYKAA